MTQLPNMDDLVVLNEWDLGIPYFPMLTDEWLSDQPHPNYVDGWNLWCDLDTRSTYVVMTSNPEQKGLSLHMGGDVVVNVPFTDMGDEPMNLWKVGYMWDNTGHGYTLGNEHHEYGWWCLDDILWNMMLWDFKDEYTLRTEEENMLMITENMELLKGVCGELEPDEYLSQLGLQMGGTNVGTDVPHLENCLNL